MCLMASIGIKWWERKHLHGLQRWLVFKREREKDGWVMQALVTKHHNIEVATEYDEIEQIM